MNINLSKEAPDPRLEWYCEPATWDTANGNLVLTTDPDTDYWQRTHYGFRRDNGHFLYVPTHGDMTLETTVHYRPVADFDQAGLMVRFDSQEWIKTSVERETDGCLHLGAVATHGGYSDWSTQEFASSRVDLTLRILRVDNDYTVQWHSGDPAWKQLRIAHLAPPTPDAPLLVGLYAASPAEGGCSVRFDYVDLEE